MRQIAEHQCQCLQLLKVTTRLQPLAFRNIASLPLADFPKPTSRNQEWVWLSRATIQCFLQVAVLLAVLVDSVRANDLLPQRRTELTARSELLICLTLKESKRRMPRL